MKNNKKKDLDLEKYEEDLDEDIKKIEEEMTEDYDDNDYY